MRPPTPRWLLGVMMALIPLLVLDNHFAYHAPGAIGSSIESYFNLDEEDLASMFTVYSAPNLLLVFLGGVLIDRYGLVRPSLVFNACLLLGSILFACAPRGGGSATMTYLLIGRFFLGVGGECLCICGVGMLARWFKGANMLSTATGVYTAATQVFGSAPAFVLLPALLGKEGMNRHASASESSDSPSSDPSTAEESIGNVRLCLWSIVIVCFFSFVANIFYGLLDIRYGWIVAPLSSESFEEQLERDIGRLQMAQLSSSSSATSGGKKMKSGGKAGSYAVVSSSEIQSINVEEATNSNVLHAIDGGGGLGSGASSPTAGGSEDDPVSLPFSLRGLWSSAESGFSSSSSSSSTLSLLKPWMVLRTIPGFLWMVIGMQLLLSPILTTFSVFAPLYFMERYGFTQEVAGVLTSLLYLSILFAPLAGWIVDRSGYRCIIQSVAAAVIPIVFAMIHFSSVSPYGLMIVLGIAFAVTETNGLAMIAEVAPQNLLGTAYGILGCGTSFFLLFEPMIVGWMHMKSAHYFWSTILFIVVSSLGWLASFAVYVYDVNNDHLMTESRASKLEAEASLEVSEQNAAYPELEIVFDNDEENEEEALFTIDDDDGDEPAI